MLCHNDSYFVFNGDEPEVSFVSGRGQYNTPIGMIVSHDEDMSGWLVDILNCLVDELMMFQQSRTTAHQQALF